MGKSQFDADAVKGRKGLLAPSILAADFGRLAEEVKDVEAAGVDWIHMDVMDGHFVPNLTFGPMVVSALREVTELPLDCHLMISKPEEWVDAFAEAGAGIITVHAEATRHLDRLLNRIRELGCGVGVSLNPATPLSVLEEVLDTVDLVLLMSVNPGFGGQKFIPYVGEKVHRLAHAREDRNFLIQVDGGVSEKNIGKLREAGCDVFVAGSAVFSYPLGSKNRHSQIATLKQSIGGP